MTTTQRPATVEPVTTTASWTLRAPNVEQLLAVTVATATHPGDQERNADAVDVEHFETAGTVAAVVLDGRGTDAVTEHKMRVCAGAAVMAGARYGVLNGVREAHSLLVDPGREFARHDGVGVLAVVRPGEPVVIAHVGRARAYSWDGHVLTLLTEDLTTGQLVRNQGAAEHEAVELDRFQRVTLARSTVGTTPVDATEDHLVVLTSDGVHAALGDEHMTLVVDAHQDEGAQVIADRLLAAALDHGAPGHRDNASVVVIELRTPNAEPESAP